MLWVQSKETEVHTMKKTISLVLAVVLALGLLAGCQDTPDTPAVIIKDQEQMLETAEKGRENSALFAALEVPERFTGEWTGLYYSLIKTFNNPGSTSDTADCLAGKATNGIA